MWEANLNLHIQDKLEQCGVVLDEWGRSILGDLRGRIQIQKRQIEFLKGKRDGSSVLALGEAKSEFFLLLQQEEDLWRQ